MNDTERESIVGVVQSGAGKGAYFTRVDWVLEQCRHWLGYEPFPGTLNVRVVDTDAQYLEPFLEEWDVELVPDDPAFCSARVKRVAVNGLPAAVVVPQEDVRIHDRRIIELLAPCSLRKTLGLKDGDLVTVAAVRAVSRDDPDRPHVR